MKAEKKIEKKRNEVLKIISDLKQEKKEKLVEYTSKIDSLEAEKTELQGKRQELLTSDLSAVMDIDERLNTLEKEINLNKEAMGTYKALNMPNSEIEQYKRDINSILTEENQRVYEDINNHLKEALILFRDFVDVQNEGNRIIIDLEKMRGNTNYTNVKYRSTGDGAKYDLNIFFKDVLRLPSMQRLCKEVIGTSYIQFLEKII